MTQPDLSVPTIRTLGQRCILADHVTSYGDAEKKLDDFAYYFMRLKDAWCRKNNKLGFTADELRQLMLKCAIFNRPHLYTRLLDCCPKKEKESVNYSIKNMIKKFENHGQTPHPYGQDIY